MADDADDGSWPTTLAGLLAGRGPMPFRDYMAEALYGEEHGYYTKRDQRPGQGRPTLDTIYVAGLARQLARAFQRFSTDHEPRIVEHGTGSVKLIRFLLASLDEDLLSELELFVVEPRLARRTRRVAAMQEFGVQGKVVGSPSEVPEGPTFAVSKELVSSFPVHWLEGAEDAPKEVWVRFASDRWTWEETLEDAPPSLTSLLDSHDIDLGPGQRYEANPQMRRWLGEMSALLDPGLLVVLDRPRPAKAPDAGTVQAQRDGALVPPYEAPGELDLSAAVDIDMLVEMAQGLGLEAREPDPGMVEAAGPYLEPVVLATDGG